MRVLVLESNAREFEYFAIDLVFVVVSLKAISSVASARLRSYWAICSTANSLSSLQLPYSLIIMEVKLYN